MLAQYSDWLTIRPLPPVCANANFARFAIQRVLATRMASGLRTLSSNRKALRGAARAVIDRSLMIFSGLLYGHVPTAMMMAPAQER